MPRVWTGFWHEYVVIDGKDKRREHCKVLGPCAELTKGAAEANLLGIINSSKAPQTGATFEALAAWYLKTNQGRWSVKWNETSGGLFRHKIPPRLGAKVAADLKRSNIQQAINDIAAIRNRSAQVLSKSASRIYGLSSTSPLMTTYSNGVEGRIAPY